MTDVVNPPCNMADPEPIDLEDLLGRSLRKREAVTDTCEACAEGEHSECAQPVHYVGDPRGDNFRIIHCCCYTGEEV